MGAPGKATQGDASFAYLGKLKKREAMTSMMKRIAAPMIGGLVVSLALQSRTIPAGILKTSIWLGLE